eukprot:1804318-Pyramimonas_sp.AAC.1
MDMMTWHHPVGPPTTPRDVGGVTWTMGGKKRMSNHRKTVTLRLNCVLLKVLNGLIDLLYASKSLKSTLSPPP